MKPYDPDFPAWTSEEQEAKRALYIAHHTTPLERLQWIEQCLILFAEQVVEDKKRRGILPADYVWDPKCLEEQ